MINAGPGPRKSGKYRVLASPQATTATPGQSMNEPSHRSYSGLDRLIMQPSSLGTSTAWPGPVATTPACPSLMSNWTNRRAGMLPG